MDVYSHADPGRRIHSAPGAVERLGSVMEQLGRKRALVVVGAQMATSPVLDRVKKCLGANLAGVFAGVTPHSGPDWVRRGVALQQQQGADLLVSVGGGSTIDTAKCMALAALLGGDIAGHRIVPPFPANLNGQADLAPALPHICIPTTGSGSEVTPGAGLRAPDGQKWIFWHVSIAPQAVLLDADVAATTPVDLAAQSSMNSLAHAVEALYAANRQPLTDAFAAAAIQLFARWLPRLRSEPANVEVRGQVQQAWLLGGLSIANARVALHHAMCHCLGARFDVPHGAANAIMLPHVMRFNAEAARGGLAAAGRAFGHIGSEAELAGAAIDAVVRLQHQLGVPLRLRDVGVPADGLAALADDAMHERATHFNPRKVSQPEVLELYRSAW